MKQLNVIREIISACMYYLTIGSVYNKIIKSLDYLIARNTLKTFHFHFMFNIKPFPAIPFNIKSPAAATFFFTSTFSF